MRSTKYFQISLTEEYSFPEHIKQRKELVEVKEGGKSSLQSIIVEPINNEKDYQKLMFGTIIF